MIVKRAYRFRIYPTSEQEQALEKAFGCARVVYNHYLQVRQAHYRIKGLLRNHRLAKSIADAGWGRFFRQLRYKGEWHGCSVVAIDRFAPSSRTCSHCFYVLPELSLSPREWTCPQCTTRHDRDINSANIVLPLSTRGRLSPGVTPAENHHSSAQPRLDGFVETGIRKTGN